MVLWFLSAPTRTPLHRGIGVACVTVLYLVAALAIWRSARRADLPEGFRLGLRWIGFGMACAGAGGLYVLGSAVIDPSNKAPFNLADILFLGTYPVTLVGLFLMPRIERTSVGVGRLLLDSLVFIVGVGLPLWFFAVQPGLAASKGYAAALTVIYPLATFSGITGLNVIILTRMPLPGRGAFRLLLAAIAVSWLADLVYILDEVHGFTERGLINWTDVVDTLSAAVALVAADRIALDERERSRTVRPAASSPLPVVTLVLVSVWLLVFTVKGRPDMGAMAHILWGLALLFVVLLVREVLVFRDSAWWLSSEIERESWARFEALVRHSSDVIMVVDAQGSIRFASPAAADAFGTAESALIGQSFLDYAHPEDRVKGARFLERLHGSPGTTETLQWRLRREDGTYGDFETIGSNLAHESAVEGLVINSRDITDRVVLEEKLRQNEKLEAIGQLVGGIAHNYNNILTSTMMRLGFLLDNPNLPETVIREVKALEAEARRTAELTRKLVMFGQQHFLRKERFELTASPDRLKPEIELLLGSGIQLVIRRSPSPEWVEADGALIDQVILSLCANARDAMKAGGVLAIEVEGIESDRVQAPPDSGFSGGPVVSLSVKDTGSGMDDAVKQRLFEPFFTTKGPGGGIGLGLASVHGIVKQHGGWMAVESAPGMGSTFTIYLPEVPGPGAARA